MLFRQEYTLLQGATADPLSPNRMRFPEPKFYSISFLQGLQISFR